MASSQWNPAGNEGLLKGITILVVEDDQDARLLLEIVLRKQGAKVLAAADSFEALGIIQTLRVDIIVSDLGLPGLNGYGLIAKIRELEQGRNSAKKKVATVPAIAVSAYTDAASIRRSIEAGFQLHLSKPTNIPGLIAAIASLVARTLH